MKSCWKAALLSTFVVVLAFSLPGKTSATGLFGAETDFPTGRGPYSLALGDLNGDGNADVVAANSGDNTVSILLGNGDGTFGAEADFATGSQPGAVAIGDFNGDGTPDLAVANNAGTVSVLLGHGDGSFNDRMDFATGALPSAISVADFNGDGKPDLAVANFSGNSVSILLGTGTGSFSAKTDYATNANPRALAVGDFNGDGAVDLAIANFGANNVSVLLGTGTGSLTAKADYATDASPIALAGGDFNGDGTPDLAVANSKDNSVSILLGTGTGSFGAKTDFPTGIGPSSLAIDDLDSDGKSDLAVTVADGNLNLVAILLGNGDGSFQTKIDFVTRAVPVSVAIADFNGDGKRDLAFANPFADSLSVLLNTRTATLGCTPYGDCEHDPAFPTFYGDGCPDSEEPSHLVNGVPLDPTSPWDFYSVPVPALFAAADPTSTFRSNVIKSAGAQAVFAYFKMGAVSGTLPYERDLNMNGVMDGWEYDRSVVGPGRSGPPDGVIGAADAQLAFAQFKLGLKCATGPGYRQNGPY